MQRLNPQLITKLSEKLNKKPQYIREQVSKRAARESILSETALVIMAKENNIAVSTYIRALPAHAQNQFNSFFNKSFGSSSQTQQIGNLKVTVQKDDKKTQWYNLWWVQLTIAFFVVGIIAGTISNVLGDYFSNKFGIR